MARKNDYHLRQTGQEVQDILDAVEGKAQKDLDAVEGNVAVFDDAGNPVDSGQSIGETGVPYLYFLTEDMSEDDKAAAQAHNVEVLDSLTSKAEAYRENLYTQRRVSVCFWPSSFLYDVTLLRSTKDGNAFIIYYTYFNDENGFFGCYQAIIVNGLWNKHTYEGEAPLLRWSDLSYFQDYFGVEGEEFFVGKREDLYFLNLVSFRVADSYSCRHYSNYFGLSMDYQKHNNNSDPTLSYYSVFFEDVYRRIELRVYANDDVTTIWHSKTDAVDLVVLDGGHAPSV